MPVQIAPADRIMETVIPVTRYRYCCPSSFRIYSTVLLTMSL